MRRVSGTLVLCLALTLMAGACVDDPSGSSGVSVTTSGVGTSASGSPDVIDGLFDVGGGVKLYLNCQGTKSPTIIYLHGSIEDPGFSAVSSSEGIRAMLSEPYRFCAYERRNVGRSDSVDGYFTGVTAAEDLHALMNAAGVEPPYVLLGASFGGNIAHIFAASYPNDVVGIVSLDGSVPGDITLDPVLPEDMRYHPDDERDSLEKLSHYAALHEALDMRPPDVPFHYLLATPSEWPTMGVPAYDDVILDVVADYVASFPQGVQAEVPSPHYMEVAVPGVIADHLEQVIKEAGF